MQYIETSESKISMFRIWLGNTWAEHCNEVLAWGEGPVNYTMNAWIKKNKWFLKGQFQILTKKSRNKQLHTSNRLS